MFKRHPFFLRTSAEQTTLTLACLISAACTVLGLLFAFFFYEESLPALVHRSHRRTSSLSSDATLVDSEGLLKHDDVRVWRFWDLWALKCIRIMSLSLFLNTSVPQTVRTLMLVDS